MSELAGKLRVLRERHALTQEQASALIGVGLKYYQAVESGRKKQIWLETVNRFAEAYGLSLQEFFSPELPQHSRVSKKTPPSAHYAPRAKKVGEGRRKVSEG